jgi:hypothetical protein
MCRLNEEAPQMISYSSIRSSNFHLPEFTRIRSIYGTVTRKDGTDMRVKLESLRLIRDNMPDKWFVFDVRGLHPQALDFSVRPDEIRNLSIYIVEFFK